MNLILNRNIVVRDTGSIGLGVFTTSNIKSGEIIEECHHIPLTQPFKYIDSFLQTYLYSFPKENPNSSTVVLGYGGIYNHFKEPNVDWDIDMERNLFIFKAIRDIDSGEELYVNYGEGYEKHIHKLD